MSLMPLSTNTNLTTMLKIATHDSATGEKPKNFLSWLLIPFARTQSKTIKKQFEAGCRSFDIRVKEDGKNWYCSHGLFRTVRTAESILDEIDLLSQTFGTKSQVCVTYEGFATNNIEFLAAFHLWQRLYHNIIWAAPSVKYGDGSSLTKVKYTYLEEGDPKFEGGVQGFLPLDGRSWHTYLPIPWLWDAIYKRPHIFNDRFYTYVDFL